MEEVFIEKEETLYSKSSLFSKLTF